MRNYDLRALQLKELEMLDDFVSFCDENDIVYFLMYGSLLGAARHQGFIPWDDDIDVVMDVKNYRKFLKYAHKLCPDKYFIQNYKTEHNFGHNWTKIRMNNTTSMDRIYSNFDIHYGVCMDIFPLVGNPNTSIGKKIIAKVTFLQDILIKKYFNNMTGQHVAKKYDIMYKIFPEFFRVFICGILEKIIHIDVEARELCYNPFAPHGIRTLFESSSFSNDQKDYLIFEDKKYRVPHNWEIILKTCYGDWQTPPPVAKRDGHGDIIVDLEKDYKYYYTGK